jgi:hypothetical protein
VEKMLEAYKLKIIPKKRSDLILLFLPISSKIRKIASKVPMISM